MEPLVQEIPYGDPLQLFEHFQGQDWSLLLDGVDLRTNTDNTNRYSYIAIDPFETMLIKDHHNLKTRTVITQTPFEQLRHALIQYRAETIPNLPPFQGGIAGCFSYELGQYLEAIPLAQCDDLQFPDLAVGFYDLIISFDHLLKKAWIISTGLPEKSSAKRNEHAKQRLFWLNQVLQNTPDTIEACERRIKPALSSNFSKQAYLNAVETCKKYILEGDIFEVNLSQRFSLNMSERVNAFALYQRLRQANPSAFSAYFAFDNFAIASASPERFLFLQEGQVQVRPIKGTAPRGDNETDDHKLAQALLKSDKDCAENVMIVDLMRNDLSKVCQADSICVKKLCGLETFSNVHHLVSVITGELREDQDVIDLLTATFPGGSITGAPKIRAMEIIAACEPNRRGPYCGSMGFIGFNGSCDLSIVIRSYVIHDKQVTFQSGGAIVLDSDAESEYQETLNKASGLRQALIDETMV